MKIKVGVIGCGSISHFHLESYAKTNAKIECVADVNETLAREKAAKYGCRWVADYRRLLDDDQIDAVSVCVRNSMHYQVAVDALKAGKHVLCEKPMTTLLKDAVSLVQAVKRSKKVFQVGYMKRYLPAVAEARRLIPKLGNIETVHVRCFQGAVPDEAQWARQAKNKPLSFDKKSSGGCALIHGGSHMLDMMRWLCGDPVSVYAKTRMKKNYDVDYIATALFEFPNKGTGFFEVWWHPLDKIGRLGNNRKEEMIEINGLDGRIAIYPPDWSESPHEASYRRIVLRSGKKFVVKEGLDYPCDHFLAEVKGFLHCIQSGAKPNPDVVEGLRTQVLIDAIYRSAETGRAVPIPKII